MKINRPIPPGIHKGVIVDADFVPENDTPPIERKQEDCEVKVGFNFIIAAYGVDGKFEGFVDSGVTYKSPINANSPIRKFLKAIQDANIEQMSCMKETKGKTLFIETDNDIIPGLGTRSIITRFLPKRNISLEAWNSEEDRLKA